MHRFLKILGDGQIWNIKNFSPEADKTFEDVFSGRALGQMAEKFDRRQPVGKKIFSRFKEKGRITGISVTRALLSNRPQAKNAARLILGDLARNGVLGIEALAEGKGLKKNWLSRQRNYWKNFDFVVIGGGVSEGLTGKVLVSAIKKYLSEDGFSNIGVCQARFPGKEAGFLGAVSNIIKVVCREAKLKDLKVIAAIGLDLGRDELGVGLLAINAHSGKILKQRGCYWVFKRSVKVPYKNYLKNFLDERKNYTAAERKLGLKARTAILKEMVNLILQAQTKAQRAGLASSGNIGIAVPGSAPGNGFILNSTDYLPFFRKQDGFNFAKNLERFLAKKNLRGISVHIINDGIAAGLANVYFDSRRIKNGKFAFFGVGSGLGGCVGILREK